MQMLLSKCFVAMTNSCSTPLGDAIQRLPSGPLATSYGSSEPRLSYSVTVPPVVICAILNLADSAIHRAPSDPKTMPRGNADDEGRKNSVPVPQVVILP